MFLLKQAELTAKKSGRGTAGRLIYSQQRRYTRMYKPARRSRWGYRYSQCLHFRQQWEELMECDGWRSTILHYFLTRSRGSRRDPPLALHLVRSLHLSAAHSSSITSRTTASTTFVLVSFNYTQYYQFFAFAELEFMQITWKIHIYKISDHHRGLMHTAETTKTQH